MKININPRPFYYHYNKPASRAQKKPLMSVHFCKQCYIVDHIECTVPCKTHHRKRQPYCVMKGSALGITTFTCKGLTYARIV